MAVRRVLRVKTTSTTTGTGTLTLASAAANLRGPSEQYGSGPLKVAYCISGATYYEIGFGTFTSSGLTLTRDAVVESSNSDGLVNLPAGTHDLLFWDPGGPLHVAITGTASPVPDDFGARYDFTGSSAANINLPAVAGLPQGWAQGAVNNGTADLTIDPNAAELVNGASTLVLRPGDSATWWCAGSAWRAQVVRGQRDGESIAFLVGVPELRMRPRSITGADTLVAADRMKLLRVTAGTPLTFALLPAATAGNGFAVPIVNDHTDTVTVDPDSSETINGVATLALPPRTGALLVCDGSAWFAWPRPAYISTLQAITSGGALTLAHGLGCIPGLVMLEIECQTAEGGYSVGDVIVLGPGYDGGGGATFGASVRKDATNVVVRFTTAANVFATVQAGGGSGVALTNANWKLRLRAYP